MMKNLISKTTWMVLLLALFSFTACEKEDLTFNDPDRPGTPDDIYQPPIVPHADQRVKQGIPAEDYQDVFEEMLRDGYRPIWIDGFIHRSGVAPDGFDKTMFNVIFEENEDNLQWAAFHGLTGASYQEKFNDYTNSGFRLEFIESYIQNGKARYAPIFVKKPGPAWLANHGIKQSNFQDFFDNQVADGYRMVNRSTIEVNGEKYVTALFDKKNVGSWNSKSGLSPGLMQTEMENAKDIGRPLAYLDVSQHTSSDYTFGPIFNSEPFNNWYAPNGLDKDELEQEIQNAKDNGYRTTIVVGYDEYTPVNGNEFYTIKFAATFIR